MSSNLPASLPAPTKISLRFSFSLFFHVSTDSALRSCALACKLASDHNNQINRPKRPIDRYHPTGPRNKSDRLFYLVLSLVSPFFYSAPVFLTLVRQLEIPRYTVASVAGRAGFFSFSSFFFLFFPPTDPSIRRSDRGGNRWKIDRPASLGTPDLYWKFMRISNSTRPRYC